MNRPRTFALLLGLTLTALLLTGGCSLANREAPELRLNGVYRSDKVNDQYGYYIRFFEDGTVLTVSSTGEAQQMIDWLTIDRVGSQGVSIGVYELDGKEISFSATSDQGTVDYEGDVLEDGLELDSHSHINDHKGHRVYYFVAE
jgi:hypothetical protein